MLLLILFYNACTSTIQPTQQSDVSDMTNHTNLDMIVYYGQFLKSYNDAALFGLARKMTEKNGLKIRIFGDSHVAGDFMADEMRSLFFDEADSPGFLYPLQPRYHQNTTAKYSAKYFSIQNSLFNKNEDYPLGGIIATANRKNASIKLELQVRQSGSLNSTILFRSPNKKAAFRITDRTGIIHTLQSPTANRWSFFTRKLHYPITITALQKNVSLGGYFITHSSYDNIVDTLGINGASSNIWQRWNNTLMRREMYEILCDLAIIAYGTNDIVGNQNPQRITDSIRSLIQLIRETSPSTAIMLLTPPTVTHKDSTQTLENFYDVQHALEQLALNENLLLFNTHAFMENSGGKDIWIIKNLSQKDLHLTPLGYRFVARKLFQEIKVLTE